MSKLGAGPYTCTKCGFFFVLVGEGKRSIPETHCPDCGELARLTDTDPREAFFLPETMPRGDVLGDRLRAAAKGVPPEVRARMGYAMLEHEQRAAAEIEKSKERCADCGAIVPGFEPLPDTTLRCGECTRKLFDGGGGRWTK